jgi:hypothetical protein
MPDILAGNGDIWHLITICGNQWRVGFSGPTGFDFGVAIEVAKAMSIEINQSFFEKLSAFETTALGEMRKKEPKKDE